MPCYEVVWIPRFKTTQHWGQLTNDSVFILSLFCPWTIFLSPQTTTHHVSYSDWMSFFFLLQKAAFLFSFLSPSSSLFQSHFSMTTIKIQNKSGETIVGVLEDKPELDPTRHQRRLVLIAHGALGNWFSQDQAGIFIGRKAHPFLFMSRSQKLLVSTTFGWEAAFLQLPLRLSREWGKHRRSQVCKL